MPTAHGNISTPEHSAQWSTKCVSLVGMPGCGKSTVGRYLAKRLGRNFVDSDKLIEQRLGQSIKSIFEQQGEAAFRKIEHEVIAELLPKAQGCVLATGGGVVLAPLNRQCLQAHSMVFYLRSPPEELFRRLRHDTQRPLLQVPDPLAYLRELHRQRDPLYRRTAHYVIETGRPAVNTLVNMIVMQLELGGVVGGMLGGMDSQ